MTPLLSGIRVVDLTSVIMGPFATFQLGALGADVIKVEPPTGEAVRHIGPMKSPLMGAMFLNANRNKRSICLDLKDEQARHALHRIIAGADVVVHNMRRRAAARLGIDAATLQALNPRLIHCTAVGFARGGPYADDAAYDDVVQALSGFAAVNANAKGEPRYIPQIAVDKISGLFIVEGVLAALLHRERTGEARAFEVTMLECAAHFLLTEHLQGQIYDPPIGPPGYARLMNPYRRPYPTKDGFVAVLPYIDKHWEKILPIIGREDVLKEDWFRTVTTRSAKVRELYQMLDEIMPSRTTEEWLAAFPRGRHPLRAGQHARVAFRRPASDDLGLLCRATRTRPKALCAPRATRSTSARPSPTARRRPMASIPARSSPRPASRPTRSTASPPPAPPVPPRSRGEFSGRVGDAG